ncbi:hypothetical protein GCK72_012076 [Caenorhabditis remanei]|uniref:Uncharacterized protein n=1 Tax=Caenorhabditis remanei TaxID=31234 RepID=A0A6A5GLW5_CAERE|nr:hypothetical protein GCK72_012076 [Caenorhabditis remanei]KAF1755626.1 hypothetical protein GCK72_012076 [Caenorhabditis remanei]
MRVLIGSLLLLLLCLQAPPILSHQHSHDEKSGILTKLDIEHSEELHDHSDDHHDHDHDHEHGNWHRKNQTNQKMHPSRLSTLKIWVFSLTAVVGISLAPCTLLFFIPAQHANGPFLKILLAFGAGGLLGDALLHIIPHSLSPHDHDHDHGHSDHSHDHSNQLRVGIYVIAGILVFMMVEQLVRIIKGGHCHSHENGHIVADEHRHLNDHHSEKKQEVEGLKDIKASAYLNLVADFVHNLTDGLAIGASFSAGSTLGWITTLTVLLHELPHEVGDFAILVQSGFSKYQAIRMQAVTALGAITGCIFSLVVSNPSNSLNSNAATSPIMPFTAGGFIYIATVSVIPELLESGEHRNMSKVAKMAQSLVHVMAICMGVGMMYIVSLVE